ncbi:MAG TPA: WYL domain-containing protein [Allocoleopsis sp.]
MTKKPQIHLHSDEKAFIRIMLLIATLINHPGVGCADQLAEKPAEKHHNSMEEVRTKLIELAQSMRIEINPSVATLRKDLETLRKYKILENRMYRWGYYVGTGVMNKGELKAAFNALESQAKYQADPRIKKIYETLSLRLTGIETEENQDFFYPVRQNINRSINWTIPEEMIEKGEYRGTLFDKIEILEKAIIEGQIIEISRKSNPYGDEKLGVIKIYPLQLIYYDIAWYLISEDWEKGELNIMRMSRFSEHCQIINTKGRGVAIQQERLKQAHQLLKNGWGLSLGDVENQKLELEGRLEFKKIKVRFYHPISLFILEGELRHPKQKIDDRKRPEYIDYKIELPERSLTEFSIWLQKYGDKVKILSPRELVEKHRQMALSLLERYKE